MELPVQSSKSIIMNVLEDSTHGVPSPTGPPPLQYDIASKIKSIAITWTFIVTCNAIGPVVLYYGLHYGTNLDQITVINIAQIPMTSNLLHWPYRHWQLLRKKGERAPRNRTVWTLDHFQWQFVLGIIIVVALCIGASSLPSIRLLTLAPAVLFGEVAAQLVLTSWMCRAKVRAPCRISSQPAGVVVRPSVYYVIEDLTACDGAGGAGYRDRLNNRYESSPPFRKLMADISLRLGMGFLFITAVQIVLIAATPGEVSFGVCTVLLWGWCALSAWWGVRYTQRALALEQAWWVQNLKKRGMTIV